MNKSCCAVVLVASTALAALSVEAELRVTKIDETDRCGSGSELSGITYVGKDSFGRDLFYAVDDKTPAFSIFP